jgi:all-beta uncharacterized protein
VTETSQADRPPRNACLALIFITLAAPLYAQSVVNPTTAEFDPSGDHDTVVDGTPVLENYELHIYRMSEAVPDRVVNLEKPSPGADGKIRINFVALVTPPLPTDVIYTAEVVAVGPGGLSASPLSIDSFSFVPCIYTVFPTAASMVTAGGSGSVTVTTATGCGWTASGPGGWLIITGAGGSGSGTVSFTATANTSPSSRSATLSVAGQAVTVTQAAACSYTVSPTSQIVSPAGGSGSVTVTTASGCTWTATGPGDWLTITSGAGGSGNGTVTLTAVINVGAARTATLTVAGQAVMVTQSSQTPPRPPQNLRIELVP